MSRPPLKLIPAAVAALAFAVGLAGAADPAVVRSKASGPWSAADTWDAGRVPATGDRVLIRDGHYVVYDSKSADVVRFVKVAGTLEFARDRDTALNVGLVVVAPGEELAEEGFDCHDAPAPPNVGGTRPALLVGTPDRPIPAKFTAAIRLHAVAGLDPKSCPAVVCCGGRMEFHGAPLSRSWMKLQGTAAAGASDVTLAEPVEGWKAGDRVVFTSTRRPRGGFGRGEAMGSQTEERHVVAVNPGEGRTATLRLDAPLKFEHFAEGNYRGEVANLSRNVVVESADPAGVRGHTMYHRHSAGSIAFAEFRHLGKRGELGRYPLHFHKTGDTMRGASVVGASVWGSENRWLAMHGCQFLVVRDCVGYKSVGHGFFVEDGTETDNILDRNLAVRAMAGKPLAKQAVPFDQNRGAGFWWANSLNTFTNNVAADCDEYGFRFENKKADGFDPVLPILQPDGSVKPQDTRVLPFVRFENNEAHAMPFFGLNLRGITRPDGFGSSQQMFYDLNDDLRRGAANAHPDARHPFWVKNFRVWETNWSFHAGTSGVFLDGLDVFRSEYGLWRSVMDRHTYRRLSFKEISNKDLHMPYSIGIPDESDETGHEYFRGIPGFTDDRPPATVVTRVVPRGDRLLVSGVAADSSPIKRVTVNGRPARVTQGTGLAEWEIELDAPKGEPLEVVAAAEDRRGMVEKNPHRLTVGGPVRVAAK